MLAVTAGSAADPFLGALPAAVGGAVLVLIGLAGLGWAAPCRAGSFRTPVPGDPALPPGGSSRWRRFTVFLALTATNPATLLYFSALAVGMADLFSSAGGVQGFVAGVALASLAWQLGLVLAGSLLRSRASRGLQRRLALAGNGTVAVLGAAVVLSAFL